MGVRRARASFITRISTLTSPIRNRTAGCHSFPNDQRIGTEIVNAKHSIHQYASELIGTFFLVFFGCGSVIVAQLDSGALGGVSIPLVFGGVVMTMIYATGHVSGAHMNPAVTVAFALLKEFPVARVPGYIIAQSLGAILASLAHLLFWGSEGHTFGVTGFSAGWITGAAVEFLLSFVLMFVIVAVATDSRAEGQMAGLAIGATVSLCAFVGGPLTGASMNPARSLGPAVVAGEMSQLILYIFVPVLGTIAGGITYRWMKCESPEPGEHGCC
ncbi:MAG: aquaporin [Magnetococcales bacterium]|nr:aquaporin [Magnetococcales bacterium]